MGTRIDLAQALAPFVAELERMQPGLDFEVDGEAACYFVSEIVGVREHDYEMAILGGLEVDATIELSGMGLIRVPMDLYLLAKFDGTAYYTKDELALTHAKGWFDLRGEFSTIGLDAEVRVKGDLDAVYTPALDYFDFPIEVGEYWIAESVLRVTGEVSAEFKMKGALVSEMMGVPEMEKSFAESFDNTFAYRIPLSCLEIEEYSGMSCYPIAISLRDLLEMTGERIDLGTLPDLPIIKSYYSPERKFIVGTNVNLGGIMSGATALSRYARSEIGAPISIPEFREVPGEMWLNLESVRPEEARKAIEAMGAGINLLLLAAIVIPLAVVISVSALMFKRRRARRVKAPRASPAAGLFCGYCGAGIEVGQEVCSECGRKVPARSPRPSSKETF